MRIRRYRRFWLGLVMGGLSLLLGWAVSAQDQPPSPDPGQSISAINLYVQACGSCHVALPPEVMPSETWRQLLLDQNHYGQTVDLPSGPALQFIWGFMRSNSRPLLALETIPYRLADSRYFRALHPDVTFPSPVRVNSCIDCHSQANVGDFITLTSKSP